MTRPEQWREPAGRLPLRFGTHRSRLVLAVALLVSGGALIQFASVYALGLLAIGVTASVAGWLVVPAIGWRRAVAVAPAVFGVAAVLNGALSGAAIALTLAGWLLVRERPLPTFAVVLVPAATAFVLGQVFPQYAGRAVVGGALGASVIAGAWLARSLAAWRSARRARPFQRQPRIPPVK